MIDLAAKCVTDIETKIGTLAAVKGKVFHVYGEDDLMDHTKGVVFPCVGVVYNGIRATPEDGATGKQGISGELVVTIMLLLRDNVSATSNPKEGALRMLDDVRELVMGTKSPSGHKWRFQLESPVAGKKGVLAYVQRWATPVQLI